MWLIKFHFGCVVIEQRTTQNMNDVETCCNVMANMCEELRSNFGVVTEQFKLDNVTVSKIGYDYNLITGEIKEV